jgi:hypothetical protein
MSRDGSPHYTSGVMPYSGAANGHIYIAVRVARRYQTPPTSRQLMAEYGMSLATAKRWRAAFVQAMSDR